MLSIDSALGIEIENGHLRLATLVRQVRGYVVKRATTIENFRELSSAALKEEVRKHTRGNGFNRENVVLSLPRDRVIVRTLELPLDVEENLRQVVGFQVDRFEPVEQERSCYDYVVLNRDEKSRKIQLQLIMARRSSIEEYLTLCRELDLYPALIQFSSLGLHQLVGAHQDSFPKKEPAVVIHSNCREYVEVVVVAGRDRFYSERIECREGGLSLTALLDEVSLFLSRLSFPVSGVSRIYLSGTVGGEFFDELRERFQECELLTGRSRLISTLPLAALQEVSGAIGAALAALTGTACSRLNLIPEDKRVFNRKVSLAPTYALVGLFILMLAAWLTHEHFQQKALLTQLERQIQVLQPQVDAAMALRDQIEGRRAELAEIRGLIGDRQKTLLLLKELTERLPDHTYLQTFHLQSGGRVSVFGYSDSASSLVPVLQSAKYVKSVESRGINRDPRLGKDRFQFDLVIE